MAPLLVRVCLSVLLLASLAACDQGAPIPATPTPVPAPTRAPTVTRVPPTPTPAPTAISLADIQAALQSVVDIERRAVESGSKDEYMSQIDTGDRDWDHFQQAEFTDNAFITGRLNCVSNVRYDPVSKTAQADVALDRCPGRYHVGMFFRMLGNRWFHSQPGRDEQGMRDTRKIGPFRVTFHAMDESYLSALERFAPAIFDRVSKIMGTRQLDVDMDLLSRPTDMPHGAFTTIALYNPMVARLSVLSPFFWPNGDGTEEQLDDQVRVTLTHEFTHHAVRTLALMSVPHWLNEGLAVYVSGENPTNYIRILQQYQIAGQLQPPEVLDDMLLDGNAAGLAYAEAYSFVKYLTSQQGDKVIPPLLRSLRTSGDLNLALKEVTGQGLNSWWYAWLHSLDK